MLLHPEWAEPLLMKNQAVFPNEYQRERERERERKREGENEREREREKKKLRCILIRR